MDIVFCGTGDIGIPTLRALAISGHRLLGAITQPDRPAGRDMKARPPAIKCAAEEMGVPVVQPERIRRNFSALASWAPDVMIVFAYGQILPREVLEIPRHGCLNLHASLLPRHRGASPIQSAVLSGDAETGLTVMYMDEGLDTGDLLLARSTLIGPVENAGELHDRLAQMGPTAILESLALLEAGAAPRIPQDPSLATYAPKLEKQDGRLDWCQPSSLLARRVRAMTPWPGATARLGSHILKIHRAEERPGGGSPGTVLASGPGGLVVAAGEGSLALVEVQIEGRKRLPTAEFLRGFPIAPGTSFDLSFSALP